MADIRYTPPLSDEKRREGTAGAFLALAKTPEGRRVAEKILDGALAEPKPISKDGKEFISAMDPYNG